jgi:hypothetical protein
MTDELVTEMQGLLRLSDTEGKKSTSSSGTESAQEDEKSLMGTKMTETDGNGSVPLNIEAPLTNLTELLFELVISHGKGLGLFATRSIARGTRIVEEVPLLAVPPRKGSTVNLSHLETALRALNHEQQDKLFELHRDRNNSLAHHLGASHGEKVIVALAIFKANSVAMGEDGVYGSGVFEHYSRINHACNPNVHNSYNPTLQKLTVHAVRQINKGEGILTSYIGGTCRKRQQRQLDLDNWDFECGCKCCTGPKAADSERRRKRMFDMDQQLAFYARGMPALPGFPVPRNSQAALKLTEDLLELYRSESITDFSLATL